MWFEEAAARRETGSGQSKKVWELERRMFISKSVILIIPGFMPKGSDEVLKRYVRSPQPGVMIGSKGFLCQENIAELPDS